MDRVQTVYLKDGSKLENRQDFRELWISPFLPNGMPNPNYTYMDEIRPRHLAVQSSTYTLNDHPISNAAASKLLGEAICDKK